VDAKYAKVYVGVHQVEVRRDRPDRFTVVQLSKKEVNPAQGTGRNLGRTYAVCPSCCCRVRLAGRQVMLRCPHCDHRGSTEEQ
jgi:hypothetical protein